MNTSNGTWKRRENKFDRNMWNQEKKAIDSIFLSPVKTQTIAVKVIDIPFEMNAEAKKLGARWNPFKKAWCYYGDTLPEPLKPYFVD